MNFGKEGFTKDFGRRMFRQPVHKNWKYSFGKHPMKSSGPRWFVELAPALASMSNTHHLFTCEIKWSVIPLQVVKVHLIKQGTLSTRTSRASRATGETASH
jgi:hypothetical protein